MKQEVAAAAEFLLNILQQEVDRSTLGSRLQEMLVERYQGHWYPDEPHRGCAYRSLQLSPSFVDALLLRAAELAGVNLASRGCEEILLWVNPGEVKALRGGKNMQFIWTDGTTAENPYSKLKLKIEPTKTTARFDNPDQPTDSPCSSGSALAPADAYGQHGPPGMSLDGSRTPPGFVGSGGSSPAHMPTAVPTNLAPVAALPPQAMMQAAAGMGPMSRQAPPPRGQQLAYVVSRA